MAGLQKQIKDANDLEGDFIEFVQFALEFAHKFETQWWQMNTADRLRCEDMLFPGKIYYQNNGKVRTPEISVLYRLAANKKDLRIDRKSLLVELRGIAPRSVELLASALQT
jgi:hypothetical protein